MTQAKPTMKETVLPISSLFLAIGFLAVGYGMSMTYISVYLKESGSNDMVIGVINSAFFAGAILSSIFNQKIISTVGHIRSFSAFAAIMVITFLLHAIYIDTLFWGFLRFVSGFAYYGLLVILESWLNEKSPNEYRGQTLAVYSITFYLSTSIGQMLLNFDDIIQHAVFSVGSVLVLCSLVLIAVTKIKEPVLPPFERYSLPKLAEVAKLALAGSYIAGFMVGGFFTMMPLYIFNQFNSMSLLVTFMMVSLIGGLTAQYPVGKLSDRYGRRKLIAVVGGFIASISFLFLLNAGHTKLTLILGAFLGMGAFCIYPLSVSRANDVTHENKNVVEISRSLLFVYAFGSFSAPLFIGIGYSSIGYHTIFMIYGFLGLFLMGFALTRERVPNEQLTVFVEIPPIAADILPEMDPRQDKTWVQEHSEYISTEK